MKQKRHSVQRTRCQERISHVQETCFSCLFTFWERLMGTGTNTSCPLNGGGKETERDRGPSQGHTARGPAQDLSSEPAFHGFFPDLNLPHHCCDPPQHLIVSPTGTHLSLGARHTSSSALNFNSKKVPADFIEVKAPRGLTSLWPPLPRGVQGRPGASIIIEHSHPEAEGSHRCGIRAPQAAGPPASSRPQPVVDLPQVLAVGSVGPQRRLPEGKYKPQTEFSFSQRAKKKLNKKCYYFYCWDPVVMATEGLTPAGKSGLDCA